MITYTVNVPVKALTVDVNDGGGKYWYVNGKQLTEEQFNARNSKGTNG